MSARFKGWLTFAGMLQLLFGQLIEHLRTTGDRSAGAVVAAVVMAAIVLFLMVHLSEEDLARALRPVRWWRLRMLVRWRRAGRPRLFRLLVIFLARLPAALRPRRHRFLVAMWIRAAEQRAEILNGGPIAWWVTIYGPSSEQLAAVRWNAQVEAATRDLMAAILDLRKGRFR